MRSIRFLPVRQAAPACIALAALVLSPAGGAQESPPPANPDSGESFEQQVRGDFKRTAPWHVPAEKVIAIDAAKSIGEGEWVVGVELGGVARAWPIHLLAEHEVINDEFAGSALAVTWCVSCQAAVVFRRDVGDRLLSFGNTRTVWNSSQVLHDAETGSLWVQASGRAHAGPLVGSELDVVPSMIRTFADWRREHPESSAVVAPPSTRASTRARWFLFDPRGARDLGVVVRAGGATRLFPLDLLEERTLVTETVGSEPVVLVYSARHSLLQVFDPRLDGETLALELRRDADGRPRELVEPAGRQRRFDVATGAPLGVETAAGAASPRGLSPRVAYPLRKARFRRYFPDGTVWFARREEAERRQRFP